MRSIAGFVGVLAALALPGPAASAAAFSFGPDLTTAIADNTVPCGLVLAYQGCTAYDIQTSSMSLYLPDPFVNGNQTGVVTALHVLSKSTAPAQFVVIEMSAHRGVTGSVFPSGILAVSAPVTLHPGINNFNTNLPVDYRWSASSGFDSWSVVGLNILDGTSPVPGWTRAPLINGVPGLAGETGLLLDCGSTIACLSPMSPNLPLPFTTAIADITVAPHYAMQSAFVPMRLLLTGDVTITTAAPAPAPTPTPVPTPIPLPAPNPVAGLKLPGAARIVLGRPVTIGRATNPPTVTTRQTLTVPQGGAATASGKTKKPGSVVIGRGSTTIRSNATVNLTIKLTPAGKALVRKRHNLKATLTVTATGSTGRTQTVKKTVTLRLVQQSSGRTR